MKAWITGADAGSLRAVELPVPDPVRGELLLRVESCGVCRTDLHVIDRELPQHRAPVVPGHQIVGRIARVGPDVHDLAVGDRVGAAWLRSTCGMCRWCREGRENLCPASTYTGWDADGGYAEFAIVPAAFAYRIDVATDPVLVAPLLCAGIIGYRALSRARLRPGGMLGVYGFGSSGHLTAQLAMAGGARVCAFSRGEPERDLARRLGAAFVGAMDDTPPAPLDAAIVFAPAGELVRTALRAVTRGGTVVLAGIHMTDLPLLDYTDDLFQERDLRTVTANTRADGDAFLRLAGTLALEPTVTRYPLAQADRAIDDLRAGRAAGSLVITVHAPERED